jgi:hypothetical protein
MSGDELSAAIADQAQANGWTQVDAAPLPCWEKQVDGATTSVQVFQRSLEGRWSSCGG